MPGHPNGTAAAQPAPRRGLLIAFEGGEGTGKTTQARLLAIWLREQGYDVLATQEPGATKVGMRLRALLLDTAHTGLSPRAETLMYAADRAEHVESVIAPALERGTVVVTDRYVDSSIAYQGRGRNQPVGEVAGLNRWATGGLEPDLTILLDLPPQDGLGRRRFADRLEAEPADFHERVREGFLAQAQANPGRYLILDAAQAPAELSSQIQDRVATCCPIRCRLPRKTTPAVSLRSSNERHRRLRCGGLRGPGRPGRGRGGVARRRRRGQRRPAR